MFYLNSTLNFGIPSVLLFQLEIYYKVDRLVTGPTAQQKGTTAQWYSNKTSMHIILILFFIQHLADFLEKMWGKLTAVAGGSPSGG